MLTQLVSNLLPSVTASFVRQAFTNRDVLLNNNKLL